MLVATRTALEVVQEPTLVLLGGREVEREQGVAVLEPAVDVAVRARQFAPFVDVDVRSANRGGRGICVSHGDRSVGERREARNGERVADLVEADLDLVADLDRLRVAVDDVGDHARSCALRAFEFDHA
jgi:hypothetical protein